MAQEKNEKGAAMGKCNLAVTITELEGDDSGDALITTVGRILLRDGKLTCDPPDNETLKYILRTKLIISNRRIDSKKSPDEFIKNLCIVYRSYLAASDAEPLEESDDGPGTSAHP